MPDTPSAEHSDTGPAQHDPGRIPAHPPTPQGYASQEPQRHVLMSPHMVAIGGLLAFFTVVAVVVVLPTNTYTPKPSRNWLPLSDAAVQGRGRYLANGCFYCHSGFTRPQDVAAGLYYLYPRVAEPGDYYGVDQSPNVLGSERTGPDLSQEGGNHPDEWHLAHYPNPRFTTPLSMMPQFSFWGARPLAEIIAFNQSSGGKEAQLRYATQLVGNALMRVNMGMLQPAQAFPGIDSVLGASGAALVSGRPSDTTPSGLASSDVWMLNSFERGYWFTPDPLTLTSQNLLRGKAVFLERCTGCHGMAGDGNGPAARYFTIKPFDFTDRKKMMSASASDGELYHRILTAGKGTAMENFGTRLSVDDIWRVVLFLRTIQNGSLATKDRLPTVAMYRPWSPPAGMLRYAASHPVTRVLPPVAAAPEGGQSSPFMAAARWLAPGLAPEDTVLVGGRLPITLARLAGLIRARYVALVSRAYADAVRRREPGLPPETEIMDTTGVEFHTP